jgi:hypothetical protein
VGIPKGVRPERAEVEKYLAEQYAKAVVAAPKRKPAKKFGGWWKFWRHENNGAIWLFTRLLNNYQH